MNLSTSASLSGIAVTLINPEIGLITKLDPSGNGTLDAPEPKEPPLADAGLAA